MTLIALGALLLLSVEYPTLTLVVGVVVWFRIAGDE